MFLGALSMRSSAHRMQYLLAMQLQFCQFCTVQERLPCSVQGKTEMSTLCLVCHFCPGALQVALPGAVHDSSQSNQHYTIQQMVANSWRLQNCHLQD